METFKMMIGTYKRMGLQSVIERKRETEIHLDEMKGERFGITMYDTNRQTYINNIYDEISCSWALE